MVIRKNKKLRFWAAAVFTLAVLLRLGLWAIYQPVPYSDTASYRRIATSIQNGWDGYDGTRTPGYPLFMTLFDTPEKLWLVQMALGLVTTMAYFFMGWQISGQAWFGGLAALAHTLNLGQLLFEANLITETLATFLVTLTLAGTFWWLYRPAIRSYPLAFAIGLIASLAWLTRPLFIFLPFWVLLFIAINFSKRQGDQAADGFKAEIAWGRAGAFLLPVIIVLGGWVNFIQNRFNMTSLTVMTGYHLIQHTGNFFEFTPDADSGLRDTYLQFRDEQIAARGTQTNAIWRAIPEMQKASGLTFYDLSRRLTTISIGLIREHPDLYLKNVLKGWWFFWRAPVYWSAEALQIEAGAPYLAALIFGERLLLVASNLGFVVSSLLAVFWKRLRSDWKISSPLWFLAGTIWIASILQTLLDHGDNPRFLVPLQSSVLLWVLWVGVQTLQMIRTTKFGGLRNQQQT